MLIKYKGHTSALLTDLCIELNIPVNLKISEEILKYFFSIAFKDLPAEKSILLLVNLPPFLKPFHPRSNKNLAMEYPKDDFLKVCFENQSNGICTDQFSPKKGPATVKGILKVLTKYILPPNLVFIYSCIPESFWFDTHAISRLAV